MSKRAEGFWWVRESEGAYWTPWRVLWLHSDGWLWTGPPPRHGKRLVQAATACRGWGPYLGKEPEPLPIPATRAYGRPSGVKRQGGLATWSEYALAGDGAEWHASAGDVSMAVWDHSGKGRFFVQAEPPRGPYLGLDKAIAEAERRARALNGLTGPGYADRLMDRVADDLDGLIAERARAIVVGDPVLEGELPGPHEARAITSINKGAEAVYPGDPPVTLDVTTGWIPVPPSGKARVVSVLTDSQVYVQGRRCGRVWAQVARHALETLRKAGLLTDVERAAELLGVELDGQD